ncbi:S9 family peptidase [Dyadobacter psychrotolerans]|uniref:S9 family peptidase n=1 Tax=Dyadobacter psychrotolerans TaxID=2541721 RepID=A0A4R5DQT6_9BACT|nr:S9 family peptidase [Dyadobacter psychrotolerans]TDE14624.1 S9 family peptidase [Dyadobacter psychrotolerans]
MKKLYVFFLLSSFCFTAYAQPKEKIKASDLTKIKQVGTIAISPDEKRAVYTLLTTDPVPDSPFEFEYHTHLYLLDLTNKNEPVALTHGSESASQPEWSPDGTKIVFVRKIKDKNQLFVLPVNGGEAWQLTSLSYGASSPKWSPDGGKVLFSAGMSLSEILKDSLLNPSKLVPLWSMEKPGFANNNFIKKDPSVKPNPDGTLAEIRAYLDKDVDDKKAKVINRLNFQGEATTQPELTFSHVYTVEVKENAIARPVTKGFYNFGQAIWTPDGKVIMVTQGDSLQHPDRSKASRVIRMNADGTGTMVLLSDPEYSFSQPSVSRDNKYLAYITSAAALKPASLDQGHIGVLTFGSGSKPYVSQFDRSAANLTWSSDSKSLYFTAASNGGFPAYRMIVMNKRVNQLTGYNSGINSFDIAGNIAVYAKTEVANPSELFVSDLTFQSETKRSSHNSEWLKDKLLSYPEKRTLTNSKGQTIEYWIMKPSQTEPGKKYPLLLQMHGGPTAMWGPGELSMWHEFQFFCSQGYGVVYANPRGSGGYGLGFMKANFRDWGTGPAEDVLSAAADAAKESWADTARQVITGGSYAGYLTAWIVGHDNRFKAAHAQRGVYELTTFMGEGNAWNLVPNYFGGYPWEAEIKKIMDANSPQTFVDKIHTPLLIKHGETDLRTGVIQSELLYKSLKILGRDVEYVRMPGGTHELSRTGNPRQRIDRTLRIYEFFERYVGQK